MSHDNSQKGSASIEILILIPFIFFFFTLAPDLLKLGAIYLSANNVAENTMTLMEMHGGMNDIVAQDMITFMEKTKLKPEQWEIRTDDTHVPYGGKLELTMRTKIPLVAFRWVGMNIQIPIEVTKVGISKQAGPNF